VKTTLPLELTFAAIYLVPLTRSLVLRCHATVRNKTTVMTAQECPVATRRKTSATTLLSEGHAEDVRTGAVGAAEDGSETVVEA